MSKKAYATIEAAFLRLGAFSFVLVALSVLGPTGAAATQWGTPAKALPFTLPCCVLEMAVVDLNGDGLDDVVAASGYYPLQNASIPIQILLNDGHGGFTDGTSQLIPATIPQTIFPRKVVVADFNGDGKPDIFIADTGYDASPYPGAQSILLLSTPDGHYVDATANLPQQQAYTHSAAAADIDGSGHMALYLGNIDAENHIVPQLLLNDGTGHFTISSGRLPAAQIDFSQNEYTQSEFVDVNGDGCPDLVLGGAAFSGPPVASYPSDVLINDCHGYFTRLPNALPAKQFTDGVTLDIRSIKLDGTGRNDLLLTSTHSSYEGRAIQVLISNGDGTFQDQSAQRINFQQDSGDWIEWSLLVDTTGQCRLDIFPTAGNIDANIFLNDGAGAFTPQASGLPTVFGLPYPIDLYGVGQTSFISSGGDGYYVTPVTSGSSCLDKPQARDFNGDGTSDILWRQSGSNVLAMWLMNGGANAGQILSGANIGAVPTVWSVAGLRDFTGDGDADILWLDTSGDLAVWLMNGTTVSSYNSLGNVGTQWTVAGTGDFNHDGTGDILWRNTSTGDVAIWLMSNGAFSSGVDLGVVPLTWQVAGTGDFNGDGTTDILWHNTQSGDFAIWLMSNGRFSSGADLGVVGGTWAVVGTGDFNGDGTSDILWRDSSGNLAIWLMNNGQFAAGANVATVPTTWSVAETGDFDGDGKSDILWIDTSGNVAIWLMNGTAVSSGLSLGNVGTTWQVQGLHSD